MLVRQHFEGQTEHELMREDSDARDDGGIIVPIREPTRMVKLQGPWVERI
jgi:hypothetical protein